MSGTWSPSAYTGMAFERTRGPLQAAGPGHLPHTVLSPCTNRSGLREWGVPGAADRVPWIPMSRRIEVELTSSRSDGTWTWRAAGAREPKGVLEASILPTGAKVGDVLRVDAEFGIDGIEVTHVLPPKGDRKEPERIELLGKTFDPVIQTLAPRREGQRRERRDGERSDRDRRARDPARPGERRDRPAGDRPGGDRRDRAGAERSSGERPSG